MDLVFFVVNVKILSQGYDIELNFSCSGIYAKTSLVQNVWICFLRFYFYLLLKCLHEHFQPEIWCTKKAEIDMSFFSARSQVSGGGGW